MSKSENRKIELLSPAKDLVCGIEAINHGADAVYIGAPKFGARTAAGNTLEDIAELCKYAHLYGAKIYVALNTILKDDELLEAQEMIWRLYEAGADALIVQDMGITQMDLPPIPLHASTQTDNRTIEKVKFLEAVGFTQVVLARELSLEEIRRINEATKVPLEVFVHGALCVSYSGQCYLSEALCGRSANRGACAQYCRLPYTMIDSEGKVISKDKHLLSLRDMNRSSELEELLDAGVSSLKIEGRLKDVSYVKNVTAYYRRKLDEIFLRRPEYIRSSVGKSILNFEPKLTKSFNRGFTDFFMKGRNAEITAFDTPKSLGELIGRVKEIKGNSFTVSGLEPLNNGDGLVYFNTQGELEGFRINKVEDNRVFPLDMPEGLRPKMKLYRNYDQKFEKIMSKPTAERKISVNIEFYDIAEGFSLLMEDETGARVIINKQYVKEKARSEQTENIKRQLAKLGNTPFVPENISVCLSDLWFIPSSLLSEIRREAVDKLIKCRYIRYTRELVNRKDRNYTLPEYPEKILTYLGNVSNEKARNFYTYCGVKKVAPAFELEPQKNVPLMFSKHCLRYSMGWCPVRQGGKSPYKEPYYLLYKDKRLRLDFDCHNCRMLVLED